MRMLLLFGEELFVLLVEQLKVEPLLKGKGKVAGIWRCHRSFNYYGMVNA